MALHPPLWSSRHQAGLELAERLRFSMGDGADCTVLALPRGGVPVAVAVAERLHLPLATWSVRKVADPRWPELAIGALAGGGVAVWRNGQAAGQRELLAHQQGWFQAQEKELVRRQRLFGDPAAAALRGRHLIVVDDGIATGMTVKAALLSLRQVQPRRLTLAVPVVDRTVAQDLEGLVDQLEALAIVNHLEAVGMWYETFNQLSDREVQELLAPWLRHRDRACP
ncbi:MAG: phosphoribosyltransferase family protein [Cyanobium sp.]